MTADFLSKPVPDHIAALGYIWVSLICLMWAWDLMSYAVKSPCPMPPQGLYRRFFFAPWVPKLIVKIRCLGNSLHFWLALFLGTSDAALYALIGISLVSNREPIPVWGLVFLIWGVISATGAFISWIKGRGYD
jgi:hypothetical protein